MHYEDFRREYTAGGLSREMLDACPLRQFERWLGQSVRAGLGDPTAMVLATIDEQGNPWQRIVLLKGLSHDGFVFYTNYGSAKAQAIAHNSRVSAWVDTAKAPSRVNTSNVVGVRRRKPTIPVRPTSS